jgi:hypothetical protein
MYYTRDFFFVNIFVEKDLSSAVPFTKRPKDAPRYYPRDGVKISLLLLNPIL